MNTAIILCVCAVLGAQLDLSLAGYSGEHLWVAFNGSSALSTQAVVGGFDISGYRLYLGRTLIDNSAVPARVVPELSAAYYNTLSTNGKTSSSQLLLSTSNTNYKWIRSYDGYLEPKAVSPGTTKDGMRVYICRAQTDNSLTFGMLLLNDTTCFIKTEGYPLRKFEKYEVLINDRDE